MTTVKKLLMRIIYKIVLALAVLCVPLIVWFIFFSRTFVIEYVDVESDRIDPSLVRTFVFRYMDEHQGFFSQYNILFIQPKSLKEYIARYAIIDEFSLIKSYPKRIRISINGSPFRVMGYSEGHFFEMSPNGSRGREVDALAFAYYPALIKTAQTAKRVHASKDLLKKMDLTFPLILFDEAETENTVNRAQDSIPIVPHIESVKKLLGNEKYALLFFRIEPSGFEYRAFTNEGWQILFTSRQDPAVQAENVKTLIGLTIKKKRKMLDYIDVRFENRLFYTFRK